MTVVLAALLGLVTLVGAYGWVTSSLWHQRAIKAEVSYRGVANSLKESDASNTSLVDQQRKLAEEKAGVEDQRTVLARQQEELTKSLQTVSKVAEKYNACSAGYSKVVRDFANKQVTQQTINTANQADAACAAGDQLVKQLK